MAIKVGINGFGRMGRLSLRAAFAWDDIEFVQINDPAGDAATLAHLLKYDSVHGIWPHEVESNDNAVIIDGHKINVTQNRAIADTDWSGCDIVIEASGVMKKTELLQAYLEQGVKKVVVTAPVKSSLRYILAPFQG